MATGSALLRVLAVGLASARPLRARTLTGVSPSVLALGADAALRRGAHYCDERRHAVAIEAFWMARALQQRPESESFVAKTHRQLRRCEAGTAAAE